MADSAQLDAFRKRMDALPKELIETLKGTLRQNANELADADRALAQHSRITGELIDSIKVTEPGESTPAYSMGGAREVGPLEFAITAGNDQVRYAGHVEFGTVHAAPHPFFFPPARALKKRFKNRISRQTRKFFKTWSAPE
jgi:HK97 gp10 family phage protein